MIITVETIKELNPCPETTSNEWENYFLNKIVPFQSSGSQYTGHITSSWYHTTSSIEMEPGVIYGYSGSHYDHRNLEWVATQLGVTCSFYNTSTENTTLIYKKIKPTTYRYTTDEEIKQVKQNLNEL